jgi:ketosteroid isomerase-like protein
MKTLSRTLALALVAALGTARAVADTPLTAEECAVWQRERTFAESVARHDARAFAEHVHEGAVFGAASPQPQRSREAIVKAWKRIIEGEGVTLEWRPHFVSLAQGADVALSRGPFVITSWDESGKRSYAIGDFVSVWVRKDTASPWMVILDGGGPAPTPASAEDARKHLDTAPTQCPRAG